MPVWNPAGPRITTPKPDKSESRKTHHWNCSLGAQAAPEAGPPRLTGDDIETAKAMLANPDIGVSQVAHRLGVSPATLYRYLPAARSANTLGV